MHKDITNNGLARLISVETVITITLVVSGIAVSWGAMGQRVSSAEEGSKSRHAQQDKEIASLKSTQNEILVTTIETSTKVDNIEDDIDEIKMILRREYDSN